MSDVAYSIETDPDYRPWQINAVSKFHKKRLPLDPRVVSLLHSLNTAGVRYDFGENGHKEGRIKIRNHDGLSIELVTSPIADSDSYTLSIIRMTHNERSIPISRADIRDENIQAHLRSLFPYNYDTGSPMNRSLRSKHYT